MKEEPIYSKDNQGGFHMTPSPYNPFMNKKILKKFFPEMVEKIEQSKCPFCGKKIDLVDFQDRLSMKEYKISGLCQSCQDITFGLN